MIGAIVAGVMDVVVVTMEADINHWYYSGRNRAGLQFVLPGEPDLPHENACRLPDRNEQCRQNSGVQRAGS